MKQIVAFGASSSKKSINKDLATYAASVIEDVNVLILDLNDFEMPIYSIDYENDNGIPDKAGRRTPEEICLSIYSALLNASSILMVKKELRVGSSSLIRLIFS